jgi:spermidine synthase
MAAKSKPKPRPAAEEVRSVEPESSPGVEPAPRDLGLKALVFMAGGVLMGLEIVGSRILAPSFGNSVFVWGSLISLFLIALSAGYYFGGRLADRAPSRALLNAIVLAVAAAMLLIVVIAGPVCDAVLAAGFGEKSGPFLAAAALFLAPSVGMGMVSPFAIRLATHQVASVGQTAGTLYALSTLGSIVGTVLTTFVLIPSWGAMTILKGLALALLATGVATFPFANRRSAVRGAILALVAAAAGAFGVGAAKRGLPLGSSLVREVDTPYHHIEVIDDQRSRSRQLRFDRFVESQIELDPPYRTLSDYTRYFHLALAAKPDVRRALFIGAGGGVGPRAFHMHDEAMEIDVVDIDQAVLDVARSDFHLDDSPSINTIAADGRIFVREAPDGRYDCIILDAFTIGGRIPFHLVSQEFFALCRQKLSPGGVFLMNINSAVSGSKSEIFQSMFKTIEQAFPATHAFALGRQYGLRDQSTNIILVAVNSDQPLADDAWTTLADAYASKSYVDRSQVQSMVNDLVRTLPDMTGASVFTDDYAPIETMSF